MGRHTKYRAHFAEQARFVCAKFGATDEDLAKLFDVAESTIHLWKQEQAEFSEALAAGKREFDDGIVEGSLRTLVQGYYYQREVYDAKNERIVRLWTHRPPSEKAIALWLANRQGWLRRPAAALPEGGLEEPTPPGVDGELVEGDFVALAREYLSGKYQTRLRIPSTQVEAGKK